MNDNNLTLAIAESTVDSFWVCMIEGRFLVGKGVHSKGKVGYSRKADCAQVFKLSKYWQDYLNEHRKDYPDITDREWDWDYPKARAAKKEIYKKLLESGTVKYINFTE